MNSRHRGMNRSRWQYYYYGWSVIIIDTQIDLICNTIHCLCHVPFGLTLYEDDDLLEDHLVNGFVEHVDRKWSAVMQMVSGTVLVALKYSQANWFTLILQYHYQICISAGNCISKWTLYISNPTFYWPANTVNGGSMRRVIKYYYRYRPANEWGMQT